jgi:hypothetical protein
MPYPANNAGTRLLDDENKGQGHAMTVASKLVTVPAKPFPPAYTAF